jgi:tetratricopeptide (TPR) repeat protein
MLLDILRGRLAQLFLLFLAILVLNPSPSSRLFLSHIEKANMAVESGATKAVYDHLVIARQLNPYSPTLQLSLSRAALDLGYVEEAVDLLEGQEDFLSASEEVACMKAEALIVSSEINEAYSAWFSIPGQCVADSALLTELAEKLVSEKEIEKAIHVMEVLAPQLQSDPEASLHLGTLYAIIHPEEALPYLRPLSNDSPLARDLVETIENYRVLEQKEITLAAVGQVLGRHSEWFLGSIAFENAIDENPDYATAYSFLGLSLDALGQSGLSQLEKAAELNPEDSISHLNLALHWLQFGAPNLAILELETAAMLDPSNAYIAAQMGQAYDLLSDFEPALAAFKHATALEPQNSGIWLLLAQASLRYQVDLENVALPASRNAVALDPRNATALDALGYTYFLLDDVDFAERFLKQSIALDSMFAPAHYHLGLVYLSQEKLDLAKASFELATQFDPEGEIGHLARRALEHFG